MFPENQGTQTSVTSDLWFLWLTEEVQEACALGFPSVRPSISTLKPKGVVEKDMAIQSLL